MQEGVKGHANNRVSGMGGVSTRDRCNEKQTTLTQSRIKATPNSRFGDGHAPLTPLPPAMLKPTAETKAIDSCDHDH